MKAGLASSCLSGVDVSSFLLVSEKEKRPCTIAQSLEKGGI